MRIDWTVQRDGQVVPLQLDLAYDPWRVFVACIVLRQTPGHTAKPILEQLFEMFPGDDALLAGDRVEAYEDLIEVLRPTGFQRVKAEAILVMSEYWNALEGKYVVGELYEQTRGTVPWEAVSYIPQVGTYALEAYRIFCLRDDLTCLTRLSDHVLEAWVRSPLGRAYARGEY